MIRRYINEKEKRKKYLEEAKQYITGGRKRNNPEVEPSAKHLGEEKNTKSRKKRY